MHCQSAYATEENTFSMHHLIAGVGYYHRIVFVDTNRKWTKQI